MTQAKLSMRKFWRREGDLNPRGPERPQANRYPPEEVNLQACSLPG